MMNMIGMDAARCFPIYPAGCALHQESRADDGDLAAKAILGVIAVACTFLAVGGQTVAHDLMGHAAIADKLDCDVKVLQHGLMTALDDAGHKSGGAGIGDFILRLVAHTATALNVLEDSSTVQRSEDFNIWINDFHVFNPF